MNAKTFALLLAASLAWVGTTVATAHALEAMARVVHRPVPAVLLDEVVIHVGARAAATPCVGKDGRVRAPNEAC